MVGLEEIAEGIARTMGDFIPVMTEYPQNLPPHAPRTAVCLVRPVRETLTGGGKLLLRELEVQLHCRGKENLSQAEHHQFYEACAARLLPVVAFSGRCIHPESWTGVYEDGRSRVQFTLRFVDALPETPVWHNTMGGISLSLKGGTNGEIV